MTITVSRVAENRRCAPVSLQDESKRNMSGSIENDAIRAEKRAENLLGNREFIFQLNLLYLLLDLLFYNTVISQKQKMQHI